MNEELSFESQLLLSYLEEERKRGTISPEKPVTGQRLADRFGTTERDIQLQIQELRNAGHPVGIGRNLRGYFFALDEKELAPLLANLGSRATEILRTKRALEGCFQREEQLALI